jgi:hypothetical protein
LRFTIRMCRGSGVCVGDGLHYVGGEYMWLESNPLVGWSPVWYGGDHTDALIMGLRRVIEK